MLIHSGVLFALFQLLRSPRMTWRRLAPPLLGTKIAACAAIIVLVDGSIILLHVLVGILQ